MNATSTRQADKTAGLPHYPLLIGGRWVSGEDGRIDVLDKYRLTPLATISAASLAQIDTVIDSAYTAFRRGAPDAYERGAILDRAGKFMEERKEEFIEAVQDDTGFTRLDAIGEVTRTLETLRLSAEEARRLSGDILPFDGAPGQAGRFAYTMRVPLGVVLAITPFNAPLNTVTHKVAPALAAGNSVILKPASTTPISSCKLAQVLVDAGMPDGFINVVHCQTATIKHLLADERVRFFAFTGSTEVGKIIQQSAGLRRTQMELGSIAFTILNDDADLDRALPKVVAAAYRKAGQVCTSVQQLLVHRDLFETVESRLTNLVNDLKFGNPREEDTFVGPLISEKEAIRVETWIKEAVTQGATLLAGGNRNGAVVAPALLKDVNPDMKVGGCEIFGPALALVPFGTLDDAIAMVNATPFGLASGIFTNRIADGFKAAREIEAGGVHINETSSSRVDLMPYGGSKDSGFGREGPQYAIHEMTEERVITFRP